MLRKVELSEESIDYIRRELEQGGVLSREEGTLALNVGHVFTYVPISFTLSASLDFSESMEFLAGERVSEEFNSIITDLIRNFIGTGSNNLAIFETMWDESDPITSQCSLQYFALKSRRYDFLKGENEKEQVQDYINDAQGYPTVITLVKNNKIEIQDKSQISDEKVVEVVKRTEILIVGAFDGEGYIIWRKNSQE